MSNLGFMGKWGNGVMRKWSDEVMEYWSDGVAVVSSSSSLSFSSSIPFSRRAPKDSYRGGGRGRGRRRLNEIQRQHHAECGALAGFAVHLDSTSVRFNNHLALEHADADPALLGRLKRAKKRAFDEFAGHAAAIIRNRQHRT